MHYRARPYPLAEYYKKTGRFHQVDGRAPAAEVTKPVDDID